MLSSAFWIFHDATTTVEALVLPGPFQTYEISLMSFALSWKDVFVKY